MDLATFAAAVAQQAQTSAPEISYGTVSIAGRPEDVVEFSEADGQVYVAVELQPSKIAVRARVGSSVAGAGEGEYFPFIPGDEVLVALPSGRPDGGAVIIARLNNALDRFPMESVAGQDPKANNFAFRRRRTPFVEEINGPFILRNAKVGAFLAIDDRGAITLKDGENSSLQISDDAFTVQGPNGEEQPPEFLFQFNFTERRALLQVEDAQLLMNGSSAPTLAGETYLTLPGSLYVAFGNSQPAEHVATVEFVIGLLNAFAAALPAPTGSVAAFQAVLTAMAAAGGVTVPAPVASFLATALQQAATTPKPPAIAGIQQAPTMGAINFLTG